jgi:3-hydroxyacyl-[acyl-carrier-protein] dehydratase
MLDIEAIQRTLPHRYPFLMVDRIVEQEDGRVVGLKNVTLNEPFFQGHFPEPIGPIMPGVLILESMAQTAALLVPPPGGGEKRAGYLVGVDKTRFRRQVVPGDQLRLEATLVRYRHGMLQADVAATVDGELAASARLSVAVAEVPEGTA